MWNATWHNFNVILLNCGMNIQIRKIQDKNSYCHKYNNTSNILTKQLCPLKITWPKKVHPYKIIQFGYALSSSHKIFRSCTTPMTSQAIVSYFSILKLFNFHAIHEREPWTQHYRWNRMVVVEKTKRGRQSHINQAYQRAMEMPINRYQCE